MRFNIDRMCRLAGLGKGGSSSLLRESAQHDEANYDEGAYHEADYNEGEAGEHHFDEDSHEIDEDMDHMSEAEIEDADEMVEVDEAMLVQELRRMKRIMSEAKRKSSSVKRRRKENLQEAQLKAIIDQEVKNVIKDLNLNSGWLYGNKKPTRSRKGYTHQGSFLKGLGFK